MKRLIIGLLLIAACFQLQAQTLWNGCSRYDFKVLDRDAIVVVPEAPAPGRPWIWRPAFFGAFPTVDIALLEKGWHVAYYDVTHLYGSPRAVEYAKEFHDVVAERFKLPAKATVEGFSRGGLIALAYAARYPETVASVYVDAPVCDLTSWPGRGRELWKDVLAEWGAEDSELTPDFRGNAFTYAPVLAEARIPIITVCGGADEVVPYKENMDRFRRLFQECGGIIETIVKPDCGHHPHSLENPEPVVDFLTRYAPGYACRQAVNLRGDLRNSFHAMAVDKKATVAFLGGSITEMTGWRDMVKEGLARRFPDTSFSFIEAGISSLGSTPHAFRFEQDVLAKGTPDLLFVEASVNDDTNGFGPREQVLGMEGIVRHALAANPCMDIIFLNFIYEPFIPLLEEGIQPDVILNHERVANRYRLSSANCAQEISARMQAGELTWEQFGGTHPAPAGHRFYAADIWAILDANAMPYSEYCVTPHQLPEPVEKNCYESAYLLPANSATRLKGFSVVDSWTPSVPAATRNGFVDVPMLSCGDGGSFTLEFSGRAVGLYCVCGPDSGEIIYRIDGGEPRSLNMRTQWSGSLYIPWLYVLDDSLEPGPHKLEFSVPKGTGCHIKNFAVNR